jgi:hypothetical protein
MADQMRRLSHYVDHGGDILELPTDGISGGVTAASATAAVDSDNGEALRERRNYRRPICAIAD